MTVVDSPRAEPQLGEAQLLFEEARQRRRRRWYVAGAVVVVLLGCVVLAVTLLNPASSSPRSLPAAPSLPAGPTTNTGVAPQIAWVDYYGKLHIGELAGLTQRVVVNADADPTASLISLDHTIIWVRSQLPTNNQTVDPVSNEVLGFDTANGRQFTLGPGTQVFGSLDRTFVYIGTDNRHLAEYWPNGTSRGHGLQLPNGWYLPDASLLGDPTPVVANGILVESAPEQFSKDPLTLAIWNPTTGHVRSMGKVWKVIGTYTKPGARSSLVAWAPASCEEVRNCSLRITDTSTLSTRLVHSPLGHGFDWGGGFSPDGTRLAVFLRTDESNLSPATQLALVTGSGSIRPVSGAIINIGDSLAWAAWYPDSSHLIAGGVGSPDGVTNDNHFVVNAQKAAEVPFRFFPDGNRDVNFSVVALS